MNSSAHHLKKSFLFESHSVNQPISLVNISHSQTKRSNYNTKTQNSTDYMKSSRDSQKMETPHIQKLNFIPSSISNQNNRIQTQTFIPQTDGRENSLQKKLNEIELKLCNIDKHLQKMQNYQNDHLPTITMVRSMIFEEMNKKQKQTLSLSNTTKSQLQHIKRELKNTVSQGQMQQHIIEMESSIKNSIVSVKNNICQEIIETNEKQTKSKRKQFEDLEKNFSQTKNYILYEIGLLSEKLVNWDEKTFKPMNKLYFGKPIQFKLITTLTHNKSGTFKQQPSIMEEIEYKIDCQGYLLDGSNYYLLNEHNQQIKISDEQIKLLKEIGVLR